ncbi:MAG: response regulator transcription factor [Rhodospirillales bacterium]|nr:response regulator transcription factor [Acetobacter sp.]
MPQPLIAVIEDEDHLAQGLLFNLEAEGYRTHHEFDGDAALSYLLNPGEAPAAVVLDVMLPGRDGFSIIRTLREAQCHTPILLLTARGRTEDVLEGFAAGADDYLPKPFDLHVLLARLSALLRRSTWQRPEATATQPEFPPATLATTDTMQLDRHTIDFNALEISGGGQTIHLTVMEADLLRYLLHHPNRTVSRREILEEVWHVQSDTDTRPIDNFIVRLRRYLEPDPAKPVFLLTVRGVGYRFAPPPAG